MSKQHSRSSENVKMSSVFYNFHPTSVSLFSPRTHSNVLMTTAVTGWTTLAGSRAAGPLGIPVTPVAAAHRADINRLQQAWNRDSPLLSSWLYHPCPARVSGVWCLLRSLGLSLSVLTLSCARVGESSHVRFTEVWALALHNLLHLLHYYTLKPLFSQTWKFMCFSRHVSGKSQLLLWSIYNVLI